MPLKNDLLDSQKNRFKNTDSKRESQLNVNSPSSDSSSDSKAMIGLRGILFIGFLVMFIAFIFSDISLKPNTSDIVASVTNSILDSTPDDKLIADMGAWMERMGYKGLTNQDLIELRRKGVTATYTSKIRELGYNPSLDEIASLIQHDVSATFASMMHSLGYSKISLDDMIRLRVHDVTAHYTSNVHDAGYSTISVDDLIRIKDARVSISMIKKLNEGRVQLASIDDLVRYGISNQN